MVLDDEKNHRQDMAFLPANFLPTVKHCVLKTADTMHHVAAAVFLKFPVVADTQIAHSSMPVSACSSVLVTLFVFDNVFLLARNTANLL